MAVEQAQSNVDVNSCLIYRRPIDDPAPSPHKKKEVYRDGDLASQRNYYSAPLFSRRFTQFFRKIVPNICLHISISIAPITLKTTAVDSHTAPEDIYNIKSTIYFYLFFLHFPPHCADEKRVFDVQLNTISPQPPCRSNEMRLRFILYRILCFSLCQILCFSLCRILLFSL